MKNTSEVPQKKKRGPAKSGHIHTHVMLPPDLIDFDRTRDDSFSAYVRRLLREDHARQRREAITA